MAAVSSDDAWAVGWRWSGGRYVGVAEHFDGFRWRSADVPNPGATTTTLLSVTALGPRDVWAVGWYDDARAVEYTLAEHWNGKRWRVVPTQNPQPNGRLSSVAAVSANDVWAVGSDETGQLIEHWDGTQWSQVSGDYGGTFQLVDLLGVTAIASDDVWAVGEGSETDEGRPLLAVAEHWDGSTWTMNNPVPQEKHWLLAVTAPGADDVWAVGGQNIYIQHYDGAWHGYGKRRFEDRGLNTIAASGPDDVWFGGGPGAGMVHWDGHRFNDVPLQAPRHSVMFGADALSPTDAWAVGYSWDKAGTWHPIAEHWDGSSWAETIPQSS